ncbi:MAG: hypothetical protein GY792_10870, partial [Gammaproteobacteria bacterium]|nr:hypothetical protein [Gammaproteobacteria bacterium]
LMLHEVWLIWFDWGQLGSLLPVYALQFALIALLLRWLSLNLQRPSAAESEAGFGPVLVRSLLPHFAWAALLLSVAEGAMHIVAVWDGLLSDIPMSLLAEPWGHAASITAMLLLTGLCILEVRPTRQDGWIYAAAALVAITGIYCRVLWIGLAPVGVWDTAAIIASGYMLFALEVVTKSRPMFILTVTLPLAALFTLPLQLESTHATLSLFALAALYLFTRLSTGMATPVYLAILAINAGIYLWVPGWADRFGLLQVYIIPAALTVLLLLHVHRHELQPNVLFGGRVTALSALYAAATLDVFLEEDLGIFMLVLMLSLAGIIIGIVTRTRAFLYAGTVFLVINVVGQLVQLYPEQRLGRALLLMAMGTAITAAMIGFNAKREAILRRIRIMRADLVTWN